MTAEALLEKNPSELFSGKPADVDRQFKDLARKWHPDVCHDPRAKDVFLHLQRCRDVVLGKSDEGRKTLTRKSGGKFAMDFVLKRPTEFGTIFVGSSSFCYLVPPALEDLAAPARTLRWKFEDKNMEQEMLRRLPRRVMAEETTEGTFLAYRRSQNEVLLSDLMEFEKLRGGKLPHQTVMWVISGLLNVCCYLEIHRIAHCAIVPQFVALDIPDHSVSLTGPALFATPFDQRPKAVPSETLRTFPRLRAESFRVQDSTLDLTMIRHLAMRSLGHTNVVVLKRDEDLPAGLREWLSSPTPTSAVKDYMAWEVARGRRAFHHYDTTPRQIYDRLRT